MARIQNFQADQLIAWAVVGDNFIAERARLVSLRGYRSPINPNSARANLSLSCRQGWDGSTRSAVITS